MRNRSCGQNKALPDAICHCPLSCFEGALHRHQEATPATSHSLEGPLLFSPRSTWLSAEEKPKAGVRWRGSRRRPNSFSTLRETIGSVVIWRVNSVNKLWHGKNWKGQQVPGSHRIITLGWHFSWRPIDKTGQKCFSLLIAFKHCPVKHPIKREKCVLYVLLMTVQERLEVGGERAERGRKDIMEESGIFFYGRGIKKINGEGLSRL